MYVVQRRDSNNCQWKTCSFKGRKCRFEYLNEANYFFRKIKHSDEFQKVPTRQLRILDTETNKEV